MSHLNAIMSYTEYLNGTLMTENVKTEIEKLILDSYKAGETSLRDVATICNTDHHKVKRVLEKYQVTIVRAKRKTTLTRTPRKLK